MYQPITDEDLARWPQPEQSPPRTPATPEQLAASRQRALAVLGALGVHPEGFTCDDCPSAPLCEWAFDGYNTLGDCLAEK